MSLIVLLIATANVATLLLLRAVRRRREIAVRIALGVTRARLARQLLIESLLLSGVGAAAGLLVSWWGGELIRAALLPGLAPAERVLDTRALITTLGAALVGGIAAGLAPLMRAGRSDVVSELHATGLRTARQALLQRVLVGLQVALCTVLLAGAGLFARSLYRVRTQDLGFSTSHLLLVRLDFKNYLGGGERDRVHDALVPRIASLPGVLDATVVEATPFGSFHVPPISVPGHDEPPNVGGQLPMMYGATPGYLRMMGVKLRAGRLFDQRDVIGSAMVVLVNETMARMTWPGQSAVGQCIRVGYDPALPPTPMAPPSMPCREVVGVVRDSRVRSLRADGATRAG